MKIGIIGAGFGGLAAGYYLAKNGHQVTIFESDSKPGGLAVGYQEKKWDWTLEAHYHHWFTNDYAVLKLAKEIGHKVKTVRPKTSTYYNGSIAQLDSPVSLLRYEPLPFFQRIRTGMILAYLKFTPFWKPLEKVTAKKFLKSTMGTKSWEVLWEPLFIKKFGIHTDKISAAWFWARIKKRTPALSYPERGFLSFAKHLDNEIRKKGGVIYYNTPVSKLKNVNKKVVIQTVKGKFEFDKVIVTLPGSLFTKITPDLPKEYVQKLTSLQGLGAVNLVLSLKKPFFKDGTYWLNINDKKFPFLALVEHTNFMDRKNYNNEHLLYVGNYLEHTHPYFSNSSAELIKEFLPYLRRINPNLKKASIKKATVFKAPFAQPIIPLNYSKLIPDFKTPLPNVYLSNIQQVYPWDRGTNYAVELGFKVAQLVDGE